VDPFVGRNLFEVYLKLRLTDETLAGDWTIEREFKRDRVLPQQRDPHHARAAVPRQPVVF
jgi:hypothetical protein